MTETTRKYRTAASIVDAIGERFAKEQQILFDAEAEVALSKARMDVIKNIMEDATNNGSSDDEQ